MPSAIILDESRMIELHNGWKAASVIWHELWWIGEYVIQRRLRKLWYKPNGVQSTFNFDEFKQLASEWLSATDIHIKMWVCKANITKYSRQLWITLPKHKRPDFVKVVDWWIECKRCHTIKDGSEYQIRKERWIRKQWYHWTCKSCEKELRYIQHYESDIDTMLKSRLRKAQRHAFQRNCKFTLTFEYFKNQWIKQNGKCFYLDIDLSFRHSNRKDHITLDKIIPELWYVDWNVVFASMKANAVKSDLSLDDIKEIMPWWYNRIQNFLNE